MTGATRWGIAGSGKISSDFANALQHLGSAKHVIVAVAARSKDSAQKFAERFGIKKCYDKYEELAKDPDVDVVYIGVISSAHHPVCRALLAARKPVLCEKPLCINVKETRELVELAKLKETFFMEALWTRYFPAYRELRGRLDRTELGDLTHAYMTFGVPIATVPRVSQKELGGGSVLDIGVYALQFLLFVFQEERPLEIKAMGTLNEQGVEQEVTALVRFPNNKFGTFILSTRSELPNKAYVTGTKGTIVMDPPFWCSTGFTSPTGDFKAPLDPSDRVYNFNNSQGLKYQAEEVAKCLNQGSLESSIMPHSSTLLLAELMQTVREQLGVKI